MRIEIPFVALLVVVRTALSQIVAYDDASSYFKSANWTNGANQGFGFTSWVLATNSFSGGFRGWYLNNGYAIASATNVSGTAYTNCSWGIYANGAAPTGGNRTVAYRGFANSLTTNVVFKLQWTSEGVGSATTNYAEFVLRNGNATSGVTAYKTGYRFEFYYSGGGTDSYLIQDGNGVTAVGLPFAAGYGNSAGGHVNAAGLNSEFTLEPNDTYRFVVRSATTGAVLVYLDGRPLAGTPASTVDSVALFANETAGSGSSGGDQNYNRMQIVSASLIPPLIVNVQPTNGSIFVNPANNVSFEVDSPSAVANTNVTLLLNGVPQTLAFNTSGPAQQLLATNTTPLTTNVLYNGAIVAMDGNGNSATNLFSFRTIQTNSLWVDVMNYGAMGNGAANDTAAIQAAINACPPGGYVWLHNGTFLSGTIFLTNNMTLFIDPTATLLGSGSSDDYPILDPPANNSQQHNCDMALVYAQSCVNVSIDGGGTINGNGRNNFTSGVEATRPISIWTALCNGVNIRNINIVDAAMWTVVNMQSDNLTISNLNINDDGLNGNRDGCDVVDCWHVVITGCTIDSGDDSICLKSGNRRGVNDLVVTNCTITRSQSNGLKIGTATTGPFTNIRFQNCTVLNTSHSVMAVESVDGGAISDVTFQGINFSGCQNAIFIILGSRDAGVTPGSVNGITFRNITGSGMTDTRGCPVSGCFTNGVTYKVQNLLFDNVNISFAGGLTYLPPAPPEYAGQYPENTMWTYLPAYGYYVRHANNVTFTNCFTNAAAPDARPWLSTNDVSNLITMGPPLNIFRSGTNAVIQWPNAFILQAATSVSGPYSDVTGAVNPYTNSIAVGGLPRFFRLRQ
ncbi:MAG TPA: glycosyl hydrolase family 28 protein [Verrucomicrobiae bacterium]|nr:glycosyl hydrolase family 28 protein [Verrucomicrobiae bacterium]